MNKISFFSKTIKQKLIIKVVYVLFISFIFFALANANVIFPNFYPFSFAFLFALFWSGVNPYFLAVDYALIQFATHYNSPMLYSFLAPAIVVLVVGFIHKKMRKIPSILLTTIYALISQIWFVYMQYANLKLFVFAFVVVLFGLAFMLIVISFLKATFKRNFATKLNLDEVVCGGVVLIIIAMGINNIYWGAIELIKAVATLVILISIYSFSGTCGIFIGILFGIGCTMQSENTEYIAVFVCYATLAVAFKTNYKILSLFAIIFTELIFGLYFKVYDKFDIMSVVSVCAGCFVFVLIPNKFLCKLTNVLGVYQEKNTIRNMVNRSKENVCKRLNEISNIFYEMNVAYKSMVKGKLSEKEKKEYLIDELSSNVCKMCSNFDKCFRQNGEFTTQILEDLVEAGLEKGKVGLLDVSQYLTSRCLKINRVLDVFNQILLDFRDKNAYNENLNSSKILIAEQLNGVCGLMKNMACEINQNISFDYDCEKNIMEELAYKNINCLESLVFEDKIKEKTITLLLKNSNINNKIIEKIISKVCKTKLVIISVANSEIKDYIYVTLKTKPNYDIVFGYATEAKNDISGDTHSVIKIGADKYLFAVCDGMGNGAKARETSALSLSLIENFYRAGFDNETVLKSVNKLLSLSDKDEFSALDLCVLDLRSAMCDFIKLATPLTFIKHKDTTEIVESSSLPIGIIDDIKPKISKKYLHSFDILILISDGISDIFSGNLDLKTFINNLNYTNPQTIADCILQMAKRINPVPIDDLTVLAVKIYPVV